ncbi:MAG: imidazole glycerol phosphate synthase subunit HisH [Alphaproteobacteria bacterium]|nr:imidazole glycerol phosphate synthase subunit HisH [Alphaproteobacteria bacterium]
MITLLNYGGGNLQSVANLMNSLNVDYEITNDTKKILNAEKIIFPGQGHFGNVMENLKKNKLDEALKTALNRGVPFLGICVGLQVLFESSQEAVGVEGLSIFKGGCERFTKGKVPQIGWNRIKVQNNNTILNDDYFYFVNSYHVVAKDESIVSSKANYYDDFVASVEYKNIMATQFHIEKSGKAGAEVIKKFLLK